MLCKKPWAHVGRLYPCGRCMPCRVAARRIWKHRVILEMTQHKQNAFVTCTYDDEHVPKNDDGQLILSRLDTQLFLKRLRERIAPMRIRLFGCAEYGDTTWRPHYHWILFGYPACAYFNPIENKYNKGCNCSNCVVIRESWGKGHILNGLATPESAEYCAGYVTKKMTQKGDERLLGRPPEFAMYSKNPGVGHDAMWDLASTLLTGGLIDTMDDVPAGLRHGNKILPLGRYLRRKLRGMVGRDEKTPQIIMDQLDAEMSALRWSARDNPGGLTAQYLEENHQAFLNFESKMSIHRDRRRL